MRLPEFLRRLSQLFHRDQFADELHEEIDLHLHLRERQTLDRGAALRQLGNRGIAEDRGREAWDFSGFERCLQDFRLAFRTLRKTPIIAPQMYLVKPHDWSTYASAVAVLTVAGVLAALIPARRGARVDPIVALRWE